MCLCVCVRVRSGLNNIPSDILFFSFCLFGNVAFSEYFLYHVSYVLSRRMVFFYLVGLDFDISLLCESSVNQSINQNIIPGCHLLCGLLDNKHVRYGFHPGTLQTSVSHHLFVHQSFINGRPLLIARKQQQTAGP